LLSGPGSRPSLISGIFWFGLLLGIILLFGFNTDVPGNLTPLSIFVVGTFWISTPSKGFKPWANSGFSASIIFFAAGCSSRS